MTTRRVAFVLLVAGLLAAATYLLLARKLNLPPFFRSPPPGGAPAEPAPSTCVVPGGGGDGNTDCTTAAAKQYQRRVNALAVYQAILNLAWNATAIDNNRKLGTDAFDQNSMPLQMCPSAGNDAGTSATATDFMFRDIGAQTSAAGHGSSKGMPIPRKTDPTPCGTSSNGSICTAAKNAAWAANTSLNFTAGSSVQFPSGGRIVSYVSPLSCTAAAAAASAAPPPPARCSRALLDPTPQDKIPCPAGTTPFPTLLKGMEVPDADFDPSKHAPDSYLWRFVYGKRFGTQQLPQPWADGSASGAGVALAPQSDLFKMEDGTVWGFDATFASCKDRPSGVWTQAHYSTKDGAFSAKPAAAGTAGST